MFVRTISPIGVMCVSPRLFTLVKNFTLGSSYQSLSVSNSSNSAFSAKSSPTFTRIGVPEEREVNAAVAPSCCSTSSDTKAIITVYSPLVASSGTLIS